MGYRLNVRIINVKEKLNGKYVDKYLELGKQYNKRWFGFNSKWFGDGLDWGNLSKEDFKEFLNDIELVNTKIDIHNENYKLYNLELLKELMDFATENDYILTFESF